MSIVQYLPPGPVAAAFHADHSRIRGLLGPVGSGKSSACCLEILSRALEQEPYNGVRSTRWAVLRNTFPELKSTTIKTWVDWFGPICTMKWDSPITSTIKIDDIGDGTKLEIEVLFMAMDRPEDVGKLKSLELTGAWMNEAGEMEWAVLDTLNERIGRFPAKKRGGPTWTGIILDTNPPDDDSWWYTKFEIERPRGFKIFRQPGGLMEDKDEESPKYGQFLPNPKAENVSNLPGGYDYYLNQVPGKELSRIRVMLCGEYGTTMDGKPVYPEWRDQFHVAREILHPLPGLPVVLSFDFGLTPAATFLQMSPKGQVLVLDELSSDGMGIRQFYLQAVRPLMLERYSLNRVEAVGDPAGVQRAQTDEKTCYEELLGLGLTCEPAYTNEFVARREAVAFFLQRAAGGEPGFLLSPHCNTLRKGFNGGYRYERLKVSGQARYKDRPLKDKHSHPHDALQYGCMRLRGDTSSVRARPVKKRSAGGWT